MAPSSNERNQVGRDLQSHLAVGYNGNGVPFRLEGFMLHLNIGQDAIHNQDFDFRRFKL